MLSDQDLQGLTAAVAALRWEQEGPSAAEPSSATAQAREEMADLSSRSTSCPCPSASRLSDTATMASSPGLHEQVPAPFAGYLAYRMLICQHVSSLCPLVYSSMELKVNLRGKRWTIYTLCLIGFFSKCCDSLESQISCDSSYFCIYLLKALGCISFKTVIFQMGLLLLL